MPGFPLNNKLSGNVVDLCPVGALGDKDFFYQQRVWYMRQHRGVCTGCATGCSIWIEENQDRIYRIKPRENPLVNKWWICNDGRYDYPHVHRSAAVRRSPAAADGDAARSRPTGGGLPAELGATAKGRAGWRRVISPFLTVEEAYLLCALAPRHRRRGAGWSWAGADGRRRRAISQGVHDLARKNVPTAAASRR